MKRFWLFAGERLYPSGGALDLAGSFDTLLQGQEAAVKVVADGFLDWAHIYDTEAKKIIWSMLA